MKKIYGIVLIAIISIGLWFYLKRKKETHTITTEKILVTANTAQIKGLDPIYSQDIYSAYEIAKVYEGLVEFHYLKRPLEIVPNLAEAMPEISADKQVYTFKIRQGVKFHNNPCFPNGQGRELKAQDFVYSFKRLADPKLQASGFWLVDHKIKGLNEWREKHLEASVMDYSMEVEGLKALDDYTLQIKLTHPYPQFLYALSMVNCHVVAHEAVSHYGQEFINHPVGTGPFILDQFSTQDTKLTYRKNPHFRDKFFPSEAAEEYKHLLADAGKKLPFVDKVITYVLSEEQPRWLKFKKGDIDIIDLSRDKIALEAVRGGKLSAALQEKGVQLFQIPEITTSYFVMNLANSLFNNIKLRQAISLAFDGEGFNKLFYNGAARQAQSTIPPHISGHDPSWINPYRVYDVEKAKKYLAAAGYPGGKGLPEMTLDVGPGIEVRQKGEFFQQCLEKIGIKVKVIENIFPTLINKLGNKATMLHTISWSGDYPDGENFLQLFYGPNQPGGIGCNFNDSTFNYLYEQAAHMMDSPERNLLYEKLNKMIGEQAVAVCSVHPPHIDLHHGWIKNYCWSNFHYGSEIYFDIDMHKKKEMLAKFKV